MGHLAALIARCEQVRVNSICRIIPNASPEWEYVIWLEPAREMAQAADE